MAEPRQTRVLGFLFLVDTNRIASEVVLSLDNNSTKLSGLTDAVPESCDPKKVMEAVFANMVWCVPHITEIGLIHFDKEDTHVFKACVFVDQFNTNKTNIVKASPCDLSLIWEKSESHLYAPNVGTLITHAVSGYGKIVIDMRSQQNPKRIREVANAGTGSDCVKESYSQQRKPDNCCDSCTCNAQQFEGCVYCSREKHIERSGELDRFLSCVLEGRKVPDYILKACPNYASIYQERFGRW